MDRNTYDKIFVVGVAVFLAIMLVLTLWIIYPYWANAELQEPDLYWHVPIQNNNYEVEKIPVYYVTEEFLCENHVGLARGCFVNGPMGKYVIIVEHMEYDWANQGCTVHDHEFYHAMGYSHGVGLLSSTCSMPMMSKVLYDGDNMQDFVNSTQKIKYPDPLYNYKHDNTFIAYIPKWVVR